MFFFKYRKIKSCVLNREGNFQAVERVLSLKPKKAGPFASLRRAQVALNSPILIIQKDHLFKKKKLLFLKKTITLIFFKYNNFYPGKNILFKDFHFNICGPCR